MGGQENVENSKWLNFELRTYNSDLGRFNIPDPYSQFASSYVGMGNNPINGVDPSGGMYNNWGQQQVFFQELNSAAQIRSQYLLGFIDQGSMLEETLLNKMGYWSQMGVMGAINGGSGGGGTDGGFGTPLVRIPVGEYRAGEMPAGIGNVFTFYDAVDNGKRVGRYRTREAAQARLQEMENSRTQKYLAGMYPTNIGLMASLGGVPPPQIANMEGEVLPPYGKSRFTKSDAEKQFIAIVAGESTNNIIEAAGIGSVMMNRLDAKNATLTDGFVNEIGGIGQYDAIGSETYNSIMNSSWGTILSPDNPYASRISGAIMSLSGFDYSNGAYFWNASSPKTGFNWNMYNNGTFTITNTIGGTTFFRYSNTNKSWP